MGASTGIPWTDSTYNSWWGCTKVGPACDAGVALLMFFAEISKKNKHFMPIVLRSWSGDKFNPEGAIQ